jgi:predicted DNA binding protein
MSNVPAKSPFDEVDLPDQAAPDELELWMEIRIYVGGDCPLTDIDADIKKVHLQQMRQTCRADIVTDDEDMDVLHTEQRIRNNSPALVFHEHGCVPHVTEADDNSITVTVFFKDREEAPQLIESLNNTGYTIDVQRLVDVNRDLVNESTVLCNLSVLTEKQREAVELAVDRGYYDRCEEACLETMADDLSISKSALSRRLKSAEAKLMLELMQHSNDS